MVSRPLPSRADYRYCAAVLPVMPALGANVVTGIAVSLSAEGCLVVKDLSPDAINGGLQFRGCLGPPHPQIFLRLALATRQAQFALRHRQDNRVPVQQLGRLADGTHTRAELDILGLFLEFAVGVDDQRDIDVPYVRQCLRGPFGKDPVELRGGAFDLEGDELSFRWSVVREPNGSAVRLESPNQAKYKVANITKPGDLVVKLEANDGTSTVAEELTVPIYPIYTAPVIGAAQGVPATVAPSDGMTALTATTRDPDGDPISHWWGVKACPSGVKPVFEARCARDTKVSGLAVEGPACLS